MTLMMVGSGRRICSYAGYAWATYEVFPRLAGPVRVEAAMKLATDRDPENQSCAGERSFQSETGRCACGAGSLAQQPIFV